jgi:hypothetical protein
MFELIEELNKEIDQYLFDELDSAEEAVKIITSKITSQRLKQVQSEPACPDCGVGVLRPKCLWELGPECPRHELISQLGGTSALRQHLEKLKQEKSE